MSDATATIHIDGAARGNPGPAAWAFVIERNGLPVIKDKGCLQRTTNNVAEYTALLCALEHAAKIGARRLLIHSDSELLVKQMNGEYRVKNEDLQELYREAKELSRQFDEVKIRHVPRAQNSVADGLCNEALDGALGTKPAKAKPRKAAVHADRQDAVREDALACLRAAAQAWAKGDGRAPKPEDVWDQLWSILEEQGIVRPGRAS